MKKYYKILKYLFLLLTIIETVIYLFSETNTFGLIYLIISYLLFILISSKLKQIIKNILFTSIGFFISFILIIIVTNSIDYIDYSREYVKSIFLIIKVFKPLLYLMTIILTYIDVKKISFNK